MDWDGELLSLVALDGSRFSDCVEPSTVVRGLRREFAAQMGLLPGTPGVIGAAGLRSDRMSLSVGSSVAMRLGSDAPRVIRGSEAGTFEEMSRLAGEVAPGAEGLFFLPFFDGERSPRYRPDARGTIHGLSFNHGRGHMVRALMEGLAYCMDAVYRTLSLGSSPQIVVDSLGAPLLLPGVEESAAWGGAILGARAIGAYSSLSPGGLPEAQ